MGEPLCAAARLIVEVPPLRSFLVGIHESDLVSDKERSCGLGLPDEQFWRLAADRVLSELRAQPPPADVQEKKALLRWLLQRAKTARRASAQLGSASSHRLEQLVGLRTLGPRRTNGSIPPGITEALIGLYLAESTSHDAVDECKFVEIAQQLGVDDVLNLDDYGTIDRSDAEKEQELWKVYRLCEDRVALLFDEGKSVLVAGPRKMLLCVLCGILLRCWQLSRKETEHYMSRIGWNVKEVPEAFYNRAIDPSLLEHRFPSLLGNRLGRLALALHGHARLLDERRQNMLWPPVLRASEAVLAQSVCWEPHVLDAASPGMVCLSLLQTLRAELGAAASQRLEVELRDLVGVHWKFGGSAHVEDGIILAAPAQDAPGVIGPSHGPTRLADELQEELRHAQQLPKLLFVAVEGTRPLIISESVEIRLAEGSHRYHTYAVAADGGILSRDASSGLTPIPSSSRMDEHNLLLRHSPAIVVLAHERLPNLDSWMPWPDVLSTAGARKLPLVPARKSFKVHMISLAQYFAATRSCRRSAWEEVEVLATPELPVEARASLLLQRMGSQLQNPNWNPKELQVPLSWQLLLAPCEQGWRYLLPSARVYDHVIAPCGGDGPLFLVVSLLNEPGFLWSQGLQLELSQDPTLFLTFPWVPVVCCCWAEHQLMPLDVVLFDARRQVGSYASRIERRIEEEKGPREYCTAFTVWQLPAGSAHATWRQVQMSSLVATELQPSAPAGGSTTVPATVLIWEPLHFAPSMTGRGLLAAHSAACVPDCSSTEKLLPLERLTARKTEELSSVLMSRPSDNVFKMPSSTSEAEEYAGLLVLEERLLIAFIGDSPEAVSAVAGEARRRIDSMVMRLKSTCLEDPPPGLKEWPAEAACTQWSGRAWDKICRGATLCQGWSMPGPVVTDAKVTHTLLWAEIATLYEIVSSFETIRVCLQGRITLGGVRQAPGCMSEISAVQCSHLGASVEAVAKAERDFFFALLQGDKLDSLFSLEVEDLPSECDLDTAGIHALVQTTNAELNLVWGTQRAAVMEGDTAQLWRVVRLRELALSAPFLLMKQAQVLKLNDGLTIEWLQQVQAGCWLILHKSAILCEALSAVVGPTSTTAESMATRLEEMASQLEASAASLAGFQTPVNPEQLTSEESAIVSQVEQALAECEMHMLMGNLLILSLERQMETAATAAPLRVANGMRAVRQGSHTLTLKSVMVRAAFQLPLVEDTVTTFANESQRRGRKLRVAGRAARRAEALPVLPKAKQPLDEAELACEEAAAAAAEAQATALLKSEEVEQVKKGSKKRKQRAKKGISGTGPAMANAEKAEGQRSEQQESKSEIQIKKERVTSSSEQSETQALKAPDKDCFGQGDGKEPEEEAAPAGDEDPGVEELFALQKGPLELLSERRKARLLAIERASGACCVLDVAGQAMLLSGTVSAVAAAKKMLEDICVKWLEVSRPVWAVLLRGRNSSNGPLGRLQAETGCSVVVDRSIARLRVAGTPGQVLAGQEWLLQLTARCDSIEVWLGTHVRDPDAIIAEVEAGSLSIKVELRGKSPDNGQIVQIFGLASEVKRAAEMLRSALEMPIPSPTPTNGSTATTAADFEISSEAGSPRKGDQTPSDWGEAEPTAESPLALLQRNWSQSSTEQAAEHCTMNGDWQDMDSLHSNWSHWTPAWTEHSVEQLAESSAGQGSSRWEQVDSPLTSPLAMFQSNYAPARASTDLDDEEDAPAVSLAEQLARQFPSARILIGAPDERGSATDMLEVQMQRLRKLLDQDAVDRKRLFARFGT